MKKKLAAGLLSAALLVGGATAAFAATDTSKLSEIKDLYQQMFSIQKQIADKEAENGLITAEQAKIMKDAIDQRAKLQEQAIDNGQAFGPGGGFGIGPGFCGGYGPGYNAQNSTVVPGQGFGPGFGRRGGMMGGYWGAQNPAAQTPAQGTTN